MILGKRSNPVLLVIVALIIAASLVYFASYRVNGAAPNNTPMHVRQ
jgi:hypothetical protein